MVVIDRKASTVSLKMNKNKKGLTVEVKRYSNASSYVNENGETKVDKDYLKSEGFYFSEDKVVYLHEIQEHLKSCLVDFLEKKDIDISNIRTVVQLNN